MLAYADLGNKAKKNVINILQALHGSPYGLTERQVCEAIQKKPASMVRYFQMLRAKKLVSRKPERTTLNVGVSHRKQVPHTRTMQVYVYRITKAGTKLLS